MKKKLLSIFAVFLFLLSVNVNILAEEAQQISIDLDGKPLTMDVLPIEQNGRVLVPFRAIAENLGIDVSWNETTNTVTAIKGDKTIILVIDSKIAKVNDKEIILDVPATILNNRTLVPIRFMAENIGSDVQWDEVNLKVIIKTALEVKQPEVPVTPQVPAPSSPVVNNPGSTDQKLNQIVSKYEDKLKEIQTSSESQLQVIMVQAVTEYLSLPKAEQTDAAKKAIIDKHKASAETLNAQIDAQVNSTLNQMKSELESNNLPTDSVDQAKQEYESEKQEKIANLNKAAGL